MTPREKHMAEIGIIALSHGLTVHDILRKRRTTCQRLRDARRDSMDMLKSRGMKWEQIGRVIGRHHTTAIAWAS